MQVIKELDYRPNALAQGLKSFRTNVIGMVLSNLKNPFWSTVLEGVEDVCRELGYNLMICNSDEEAESEEKFIREFQMRQVDGIVINPTLKNLHVYQKMVDEKYPFVVINRTLPIARTPHVVVDNRKGASMAINHLLHNGRRKPAVCIYNNPVVTTWKERLEGYCATMKDNGYADEDLRIIEIEPRNGNIKEAVQGFLKRYPDTDAIFSTNNMMTLEIIESIKEMNLTIPEDIAIVGYDETVWSRHLHPPLTTIWQPGYEMGQLAVKMLIKMINSKRAKPSTVVLEPKLIVRASSGPIQKQ